MRRPHSADKAFTLVEMLISMVTFALVMALAMNTLVATNAVRQAASARLNIYQNARGILNVMAEDIRNATLREKDVRIQVRLGVDDPYDPEDKVDVNSSFNPLARGRFQVVDWPPYTQDYANRDPRVYRGNGEDDDGDGNTDEEAYDGMDNDGDGENQSPTHPKLTWKMADGIDNDGNGLVDEGIDEDIFYSRDMINFLVPSPDGESAGLMEVGYAIDHRTARDLLRRTELAQTGSSVDGVYNVAVGYEVGKVQPPPSFRFNPSPEPLYVPWFDPNRNNPETESVEPFALNVLGLDFRCYYYDYVIGEEKTRNVRLSTAQDQGTLHPYSLPTLSWDSSIEQIDLVPYGSLIGPGYSVFPNGTSDMALVPGSDLFEAFDTGNPLTDMTRRQETALELTDGLPRVVEITIWVQDERRYRDEPIRFTTRVFLSFNTGDE